MKIKKINQDFEIEVKVKTIRLPSLNKKIDDKNECEYIDFHSFNYGNNRLLHAFFKEFTKDEEMFEESFDDEYQPIYGNEYDCNGNIDLIPVLELEENIETGIIYLIHNIPFIAATENKLICLTRINYYMVNVSFDGGYDLDELCYFIGEELNRFSKC